MEKFWAAILIFVVVAAAGLMYVNQVYNPQKDSQIAMAAMANQTLSVVSTEIGVEINTFNCNATEAKEKISLYCNGGHSVRVLIDGQSYDGAAGSIDNYIADGNYEMTITKVYGEVTMISLKPI